MKFFADTAELGEIRELAAMGLLDGVTTNPSLVAKSGRDFKDVIREICAVVEGPVSAEVTAIDTEGMLAEGRRLAELPQCCGQGADDVGRPKGLPHPFPGRHQGQCDAVLQRQSGAACRQGRCRLYLALHWPTRRRRSRRHGSDRGDPSDFDNYDFETEILAASIRTVNHVKYAALAGADVATVPPRCSRR